MKQLIRRDRPKRIRRKRRAHKRPFGCTPHIENLEQRICLTHSFIPGYDFSLIAQTSNSGVNLESIEPFPSINDAGTVAFVGRLSDVALSPGEGIFVGNGSSLRNITEPDPRRTFAPAVQINNDHQVVGRDVFVSEGPPESVETRLRIWNGDPSDPTISFEVVASDVFTDPIPTEGVYETILGFPAINEAGDTAFTAISDFGLTLNFHRAGDPINDYSLLDQFAPLFNPLSSLSSDEEVVLRAGSTSQSPIVMYRPGTGVPRTVANAGDFSELGQTPAVAQDGQVVVFYGNLTDTGASRLTSLNGDIVPIPLTAGPGIFAGVRVGSESEYYVVRIAGSARNGVLDAGERLAVNQDVGPDFNFDRVAEWEIGSFTADAPVAVAMSPDGYATIVYVATDFGRSVSNAVMEAGSQSLTTAANPFSAADVGKRIIIEGAGAGGSALVTTIVAFENPGQVELADSVTTAVSGVQARWEVPAVFSSRLNIFDYVNVNGQNARTVGAEAPIRVARVGQTITADSAGGSIEFGKISSLSIYDSVNANGQIALWTEVERADQTLFDMIALAIPHFPNRLQLPAAPPGTLPGPDSPVAEYAVAGYPAVDLAGNVIGRAYNGIASDGGENLLIVAADAFPTNYITRAADGTQEGGGLIGDLVSIVSGPGAGQTREIVFNTERQLVVSPDWNVLPGNGSQFRIEPRINQIVIHATDGFEPKGINSVRDGRGMDDMKSHYLVTTEGRVIQMVSESEIVRHADNVAAGPSARTDFVEAERVTTRHSIGIELVDDKRSAITGWPTDIQLDKLALLVRDIALRHGILERQTDGSEFIPHLGIDWTDLPNHNLGFRPAATTFDPNIPVTLTAFEVRGRYVSATRAGQGVAQHADGYPHDARGVLSHGQVVDRTNGKQDPQIFDWDDFMTRVNRAVTITLNSPANLFVTDPLGRRAGVDPQTGEELSEIPGVVFSGAGTEPQTMTLLSAVGGDYTIEVVGTASGHYSVDVLAADIGASLARTRVEGNTEAGTSTTYMLFHNNVDIADFHVSGDANLPPVAFDDTAFVEGTAININILGNDSDPEGALDPTTVTISEMPSNGQVAVDPLNGTIIFTANPGFVGTDSFKYTVQDDAGATSNEGLVTLFVLTPLAAELLTAIQEGVETLAQFGSTFVADSGELESLFTKLPLVDFDVQDALAEFPTLLELALRRPIDNYVASDPTPTLEELVSSLDSVDLSAEDGPFSYLLPAVTGELIDVNGQQEIRFNLTLEAENTFHDLAIDLGDEARDLGLDLAAAATASLHAAVTFNLTFGLDLAAQNAGQSFFISDATLRGNLQVEADNIDVRTELGGFGIEVVSGTAAGTVEIDLSLQDPGTQANDGRTTLQEMVDGLSDMSLLVSPPTVDAAGEFNLPVTADPFMLGGLTVALSGSVSGTHEEFDYALTAEIAGAIVAGLVIQPLAGGNPSRITFSKDDGLDVHARADAFGVHVNLDGEIQVTGDFSIALASEPFELAGAMVALTGNLSRQAGELDWGLTGTITNWQPAPFWTVDMLEVTLDEDGIGFETTTTIAGVSGIHLVGDYRFDDSTYALTADVPIDWTPVSQVNLSDVHFFVTNRNTDDTAGPVRIGASAELGLFGTQFLVAARVTGVGQQWLAATPASGEWNPVPIPGFSIGQPFLVASTYDFVLELPAPIEVTNPPTPLDIDQRQIYAGINLLGSGVLPESIPGVGGSAIQIAGLLPADLDLAKLSIDAKLVFANAPEIAGLLALDAVGLRITGATSIAVFGQGRVLHDQIPSLDQDIAVEVALVIDILGTTVSGSLSLLSPIPNLFGVEGLNVIEGDGEFGINFATTPLPLPTIGFNFLVELPEFAQNTLGLPSQIGASLNVSTTQPILAMSVVDWRPFEPLGIDDLVIDQGSVVVAPNGGTIGTKVFPRGFSAAFDGEIVGTDVSFVGVFDQATRGIIAKGRASGSAIAGIGISPNGCDGLYEDGVDNSTPDWIDPDADNGARFTATVTATAPQDNGFTVDFAVDLPGTGGLVCVHGEQTNSLLVLDGTITNWTPLPTVSLAGSLHAEVGVKSQGMELGFDVHGQILGAMTHFVGAISASDAGFELFATGTIAWRFPGGGKFVDLAATIDINKDASFRIEVAADLTLPGSRSADVLLSGEISSSGVDIGAIVDDWQLAPGVSFEGTVDVAANIAGSQLAVNIDVDANLIGSTLNLEGQLLAGSSGFDLDLDGHVRFGGTRVGLVILDLDASLDTRTTGFVIQFDGTLQVFSGGIEVDVQAELESSSSGWRIEVEANVDVFDFSIPLGIGTVELDLDLGGRLQFGSSLSDFAFELFVDGEASIEVDDVGSSTIDIDAELKIEGDEIVIPNAKPKITYTAGIPTGISWKDLKLRGADPSPPRVTVTAERVLVPGLPVIVPLPLQIRGGSRSEQVEVFRRLSPPNSPGPGSGNVVVRAKNDIGEWVTLLELPASLISLIDVDMRGGDDSVTIHPTILIPTVIKGGSGSDTIQGGAGVDTIYGGSNSSDGGGGARRRFDIPRTLLEDRGDTINGGPGNDTIFGEAGNDVIVGGGGNDTIDGGTGVNIINGALQVPGTDRNDRLDVATNVRVTKSFLGSLSGSPELSFETDVIVRSGFGAGPLITLLRVPLNQISAIHIDAGSGNDTITVSPQIALPTVLRGGPGNDAIHAGAGPSVIFGGDGDDRIYGGPANDTIDCGPGIDTVVSSGGTDVVDPTSCEYQIAGPEVGSTDPGENHPPILAAIGDKTVDEGSPLTFTAFATDQGDEARFVGRNGYQSAQDSPFNGLDFSYFHLEDFEDGALNTPGVTASAGEVYPAPKPADLVSQWRANGTAADSAGGNDGILRGNTGFADGHLGEAFAFDGAGDYVEVPDSPSLRFRNELTLEGWVFLSDVQRRTISQSIAAKGTRLSGSVWELSVVSDPIIDRPRLQSHARLADGSTISITGDTTLRLNEWYHVAMTYNGLRLACYVNGELDGSIAVRSSQLLALSTGPLLIGEDLSGLIDELSIYDRALSEAEIQTIVNAGGDDSSTDSVDSDDGEIDGRGTAGKSFVIDSGDPVVFTFNADTLRGLPTHVGIVWTDSMLGTQLTLEAFDANGASLGTTVGKLRDPSLFGRTAEDRFLGITYTAGISKIELRSSDDDGPIELDHLQYGRLRGQPVRYSLDPGAPDGATINPLTGVFSWTPSEEQGPNEYWVTIRASDGGSPVLSDSQTFTITVNEVNDPPQMPPIPDLFVVQGQPVQFTVIASDFDLTTTAGLSFHLAGGAPAGATIDPLTGEFRWTPSVTQPLGESFVTVLVTDRGDSPRTSGITISITVQADINPPTVTDVRFIADSQAITSIVIDVSEPLEPASASDSSHYHLVGLGADGRLGTADDHEVPLSAAAYVAGARAIALIPQEHLPLNEMFKLLVQPEAGAGGSPLADVFGNTLDGDANGLAGGNHEIEFARGKSLSFLDHDGDTVNLTLWGSGVMELLQSGAGGALNLRVLALKAGDAYLSGEVTAAATNSDGLASLNVSGLSGVENLLSDPPFVLTVNARGIPPIVTLPGDFNRDGTVDAADYVVWRKTLGASQIAFTGADGNGDEIVDPADHAVWNANFGQSIASPPPLPGDFNRDAAVDASDYVTWRKAMGTSTSAFAGADGNGNGLVDDADYAVWRANFGLTLAASASSAAHSVETSEAPPSSGSVQVFATGQAKPQAGSWQNAKVNGIGQPTTVSADLPSPLAILATSFDFARKTVRQPFRPATAFETQDRALLALISLLGSSGIAPRSPFGSKSDLAFTLHETDRYLARSQELLLETVSDANREWLLESEHTGLDPLNLVDKRLSIRDELFSKW